MDPLSIASAIFLLSITYLLFVKFFKVDHDNTKENFVQSDIVSDQTTSYTRDFYPWWKTPRWFNYDGWLYQKP